MTTTPQARRIPTALIWLLSVILAISAGWWAGSRATNPPRLDNARQETVTTTVTKGTIQREQSYAIQVNWSTVPTGTVPSAGTLTSLLPTSPSGTLRPGDIAFTIDLKPTYALTGTVPAFREMSVGTNGQDVRQLEDFLHTQGLLKEAANSTFDQATAVAVRAWYTKLQLPEAERIDSVPPGRIVFLPKLPARYASKPDVRVGTQVTPGQELLVGSSGEPAFTLPVVMEMLDVIKPGLPVTMDVAGKTWQAVVDKLSEAPEQKGMVASLKPPPEKQSICPEGDCSAVFTGGEKPMLTGKLVIIPPTNGLLVPAAAVRTDAQGRRCLLVPHGQPIQVKVVATASGQSIIEGAPEGNTVLVTGGDGSTC